MYRLGPACTLRCWNDEAQFLTLGEYLGKRHSVDNRNEVDIVGRPRKGIEANGHAPHPGVWNFETLKEPGKSHRDGVKRVHTQPRRVA